jgi:hypothetical protein
VEERAIDAAVKGGEVELHRYIYNIARKCTDIPWPATFAWITHRADRYQALQKTDKTMYDALDEFRGKDATDVLTELLVDDENDKDAVPYQHPKFDWVIKLPEMRRLVVAKRGPELRKVTLAELKAEGRRVCAANGVVYDLTSESLLPSMKRPPLLGPES